LARHGNIASWSDIVVGARALEVGIWGAYQNVLINLEGIRDEAFRDEILAQAEALAARAAARKDEVLAILAQRRS
jgi:glutamate formiminotransferase/formiminotetrahydrofolate cyclodeaminase